MNPILKYPGAKWRIAEWIIRFMPPHSGYVEPFFGSGAVFLNKAPSKLEVINDNKSEITTYFRVLRDKPRELATAVIQRKSYAYIDQAEGADGSVTFTCLSVKPAADLTLQVRSV